MAIVDPTASDKIAADFGAKLAEERPSPPYIPSPRVTAQLAKVFTYHPPKGDQVPRYTALRDKAADFARFIVEQTPESREQSLALTKLEEAVMWANAGIARNE